MPTTRSRAKLDGRPGELAAQYYAQRASMGLQITEGTQPSEEGQGFADSYRRATTYVDDILRGAKLADLPVQAVDKYYLVINLATAKTLELTIPPTLLAVADDIVE